MCQFQYRYRSSHSLAQRHRSLVTSTSTVSFCLQLNVLLMDLLFIAIVVGRQSWCTILHSDQNSNSAVEGFAGSGRFTVNAYIALVVDARYLFSMLVNSAE